MPDPVVALTSFAAELRQKGLNIGSGEVINLCKATAALAPIDATRLYWAGRATLVHDPDDVETFDEVFRTFFSGAPRFTVVRSPIGVDQAFEPMEEIDPEQGTGEGEEEPPRPALASGIEVLRTKSFDAMSDQERAEAERLITALRPALPSRTTRRLRHAPRGRALDARKTLRASLRTGGEPYVLHHRDRTEKDRSLVLILDVSGSMGPYARALMRFGHAAMSAGHRVEVFCFGTRLTRITQDLRSRDADNALQKVAETVTDWQGGTRIGESLRSLLVRHGQDAHLRGSVVVICSDGLDRGDPSSLAVQMGRLRRLAHQIVWVNPLKGSERYQPLARGMAASLPFIDNFVAGHNLKSLEELGRVLDDARRGR